MVYLPTLSVLQTCNFDGDNTTTSVATTKTDSATHPRRNGSGWHTVYPRGFHLKSYSLRSISLSFARYFAELCSVSR